MHSSASSAATQLPTPRHAAPGTASRAKRALSLQTHSMHQVADAWNAMTCHQHHYCTHEHAKSASEQLRRCRTPRRLVSVGESSVCSPMPRAVNAGGGLVISRRMLSFAACRCAVLRAGCSSARSRMSAALTCMASGGYVFDGAVRMLYVALHIARHIRCPHAIDVHTCLVIKRFAV
jgi:hypothetical protein